MSLDRELGSLRDSPNADPLIARLARQASSTRLWFIDTVMEVVYGRHTCPEGGCELEGYAAPVQVKAVARVLRERLNAEAEAGTDPYVFIHQVDDVASVGWEVRAPPD